MKYIQLSLLFSFTISTSSFAIAQELEKIPSNFDTSIWARPTAHPPEMNFPRAFGQLPAPCAYSHLRYDDPVGKQGEFKKSPLHVFFGNTLTNANSTYSSLRTTGEGTCFGGPLNRTAFYIPSIYNAAGKVVLPDFLDVYYRGNPSTRTFPRGLKMFFGYDKNAIYTWEKNSPRYAWSYHENGGWHRPGTNTHFPTLASRVFSEAAFQNSAFRVAARAVSPDCWDGTNLDSPNHRSHLAYSTADASIGAACPASHPVRIPQTTVTAYWKFIDRNDLNGWYLSSDRINGEILAAGTNFYVGMIPAWDDNVMEAWVSHILNGIRYGAYGRIDGTRILEKPPTSKLLEVSSKVEPPFWMGTLQTRAFPHGLPESYNNIVEPPAK